MTSSPEPTSEYTTSARQSASPTPEDTQANEAEIEPTSDEAASPSPDPQPIASSDVPSSSSGAGASASDWQAIWAPTHNAYYFYNAVTQETTWENPLQQDSASAAAAESTSSPAEASTSASAELDGQPESVPPALARIYEAQAAAAAQGIDPSLAFLDPSLAAGPSAPSANSFTAKFNARTGAFARPDARDPTHLSEYERMKRMNEVFFDSSKWEEELEQQEGDSKKRKKPTKKDLERFKEQKRQKKIAKTAWLRT